MIDALFDLLGTFYQSGNFEQAEWIARSILQAIPDDIVSLQFLGLLYHRTRRRAQAMQVFAATASEPPQSDAPDLDDLQASAQCRRAASTRSRILTDTGWPSSGGGAFGAAAGSEDMAAWYQ